MIEVMTDYDEFESAFLDPDDEQIEVVGNVLVGVTDRNGERGTKVKIIIPLSGGRVAVASCKLTGFVAAGKSMMLGEE